MISNMVASTQMSSAAGGSGVVKVQSFLNRPQRVLSAVNDKRRVLKAGNAGNAPNPMPMKMRRFDATSQSFNDLSAQLLQHRQVVRDRLQSASIENRRKSLTKMYSLSTKKLGMSNEELPRGDYPESRNSQPLLLKA